MTTFTKLLAGGAAVAAIAAAAPASAQYYQPYGYGYAQPYGYANAYGYNSSAAAAQRCTAAVQNRLNSRVGLDTILGALLGANTAQARVVSVTQVNPRRNSVRVHGLASSGRYAGYGPYGVGAYGAVGYGYQPDIRFSCTVDYRGYVRDVDINRR